MKSHGLDMRGPFKVQRVATLPIWTPADEGREIYVLDEGKKYYADGTTWVDYSIAKTCPAISSIVDEYPYRNFIGDNGRFAGDVGQYIYTTTYSNASGWFINTIAGTGRASGSAGEFIHNNNDYGGTAGSMTQTVIDLVETMGRNSTDKRYGVEFFVYYDTHGAGTSGADTFPGGTRYVTFLPNKGAFWGNSGWGTFVAWIRAVDGPIGIRASTYDYFELNQVEMPLANYDVATSDGWVYMLAAKQGLHGYSGTATLNFPYINSNSGTTLQIAIPAFFNGLVKNYIHTAPIVSR